MELRNTYQFVHNRVYSQFYQWTLAYKQFLQLLMQHLEFLDLWIYEHLKEKKVSIQHSK